MIESAEMASTSSGSGGGGGGGQLLTSFISSVKADLDSPVTSNFGTRIGEYRAQVNASLDFNSVGAIVFVFSSEVIRWIL